MNQTRYVSASKIKQRYQISTRTLQRWADASEVGSVRTPGGKRLYSQFDIDQLFSAPESSRPKAKICYARVSSHKQEADLQRQIADLQRAFPGYELISEIGSGLNYNRPKFRALLDRVYRGDVEEVCVAHKDRMCRYGLELVEYIFQKSNAKLVVQMQETDDAQAELAEDLLAIVTYFTAKNNGQRGAKKRRLRKAEEASRRESDQNQTPS
jgi:putative resolvase